MNTIELNSIQADFEIKVCDLYYKQETQAEVALHEFSLCSSKTVDWVKQVYTFTSVRWHYGETLDWAKIQLILTFNDRWHCNVECATCF